MPRGDGNYLGGMALDIANDEILKFRRIDFCQLNSPVINCLSNYNDVIINLYYLFVKLFSGFINFYNFIINFIWVFVKFLFAPGLEAGFIPSLIRLIFLYLLYSGAEQSAE